MMLNTFCRFLLALTLPLIAACSHQGPVFKSGPPPSVQFVSPYDIYVDAQNGDDVTGDGSVNNPYKTITKGLSVAQPSDSVKVAPGTYDVANGEQFPLEVPYLVSLIGDPDTRGGGATPTWIKGYGHLQAQAYVTIAAQETCQITGFTITNDQSSGMFADDGYWGLYVSGHMVRITRNTIRGNADLGAYFGTPATACVFSDNFVRDNHVGVSFAGPGVTKVEHNSIKRNWRGVSAADETDLGGGAAGSAGKNTITQNTHSDLYAFGPASSTLRARYNYWDHVPPTEYYGDYSDPWNPPPPPPAGVDILRNSRLHVDTLGAMAEAVLVLIPDQGPTLSPMP